MDEMNKCKVSTVCWVYTEFHTELPALGMCQAFLQYVYNAVSSTQNNHTSSIWLKLPSSVKPLFLQTEKSRLPYVNIMPYTQSCSYFISIPTLHVPRGRGYDCIVHCCSLVLRVVLCIQYDLSTNVGYKCIISFILILLHLNVLRTLWGGNYCTHFLGKENRFIERGDKLA